MRSLGSAGWLGLGSAGRVAWLACLGLFLAGCGSKLRLAPVPQQKVGADQARVHTFDFGHDGKAEYRQVLEQTGQVRYQQFDRDGDGVFEEALDRATLDANRTKHIFILLDGVPYSLMEEMWQEGHFRLFSRPGQLVSTFPSLTDPAYYRLFHCGAPYGYEAAFCDRATGRQTGGADFYLSGKNEAWVCGVDHRLNFIEDAIMYLFPGGVFKREMVACQKILEREQGEDRVVLYLLSTDGICHMFSREKAKAELAILDRWIEQMVYEANGRVHLTMFADHGNNFTAPHFVDIRKVLKNAGLHVTDRLRKPGDVVAPRFGLINFAGVCCYDKPALRKTVDALVAQEGIETVAWNADGAVHVANRSGTAVIRRRATAGQSFYSYQPVDGDPLDLLATMTQLQSQGLVDGDGFVSDATWFEATKAGSRPFAVPRLYGALHVDVLNPADIVISLADGYFCGDPAWTKWVKLGGTHGGLSRESTVTFLMSSVFVSPDYVRTDQVLPLINQYVTWTPHIDWVDYAWLDKDRALQDAPVAQKTGSPAWPASQPVTPPPAKEASTSR